MAVTATKLVVLLDQAVLAWVILQLTMVLPKAITYQVVPETGVDQDMILLEIEVNQDIGVEVAVTASVLIVLLDQAVRAWVILQLTMVLPRVTLAKFKCKASLHMCP